MLALASTPPHPLNASLSALLSVTYISVLTIAALYHMTLVTTVTAITAALE